MSNASGEVLTGFDLWTPNDYSNFITISAAAIGSTLLVIFKSRCKKITICCGLLGCDREVQTDSDEENPPPPEDPPLIPPPADPIQPAP
jgi:hypothetical protein